MISNRIPPKKISHKHKESLNNNNLSVVDNLNKEVYHLRIENAILRQEKTKCNT